MSATATDLNHADTSSAVGVDQDESLVNGLNQK